MIIFLFGMAAGALGFFGVVMLGIEWDKAVLKAALKAQRGEVGDK